MYTFANENPSQLCIDAAFTVLRHGKELAPRGKKVLELHPAAVEFLKPTNRVTFVKGRKINPFFQLAESFWILLGRADVEWLTRYNENMKSFSDDGVYFNAPYGERMRAWGLHRASGDVFNPIDQLHDAFLKLEADPDTRQAFVTIGDPRYDNADYTLGGGKDIACNREIYFKIRDGKLDITVSNRSNDVWWGTWGANLAQFSTIQEYMASMLGVGIGKYTQFTDSLHIYTEDYGSKITDDVLEAYGIEDFRNVAETPEVEHFEFENEPRMEVLGFEEGEALIRKLEYLVESLIHVNDNIVNTEIAYNTMNIIKGSPDPYFRMTLYAMMAYRAHKLGNAEVMVEALRLMADGQWKLSCLFFLYNKYKGIEEFEDLYSHYTDAQKAYIEGK